LKLNALEPFASRRIIPSMRRLILAVMIVLLPLRGWIGDAMALEAATGTPAAIQSIAIDVHPTLEITHFEADSGRQDLRAGPVHCPDHASAPPGEDDSDTSANGHRVPGLPYRGHERGCGAIASAAPAGPRAGNAVSPLHQRPAGARPEATHFLTSLPVVRLPSGV
jgi:hypothetical protein